MKTFDGQNPWIIVGTEGGLYTGYQASEPLKQHLSVILIDWDAYGKDESLDDILENLLEILPHLRETVSPGKVRRTFRMELVNEYRQDRRLGTKWWEIGDV